MTRRKTYFFVGLFLLVLIAPEMVNAQDNPDVERFFPRQGFMLSGYGGAGYNAVLGEDDTPNNFATIFAPIMLFQISDRFLFEGEFEFELEEGVTETELEYAQVDISINDHFTVMAGKFLLPFNTFSERSHPVWINRFISVPGVYGSHGGAGPADPLLPILSDIGVQLRGVLKTGRFSSITAEVFVTQGPVLPPDEHTDAEEGAIANIGAREGLVAAKSTGTLGDAGDLAFGTNSSDNNEDKMIGGRIGYGLAPFIEINVSGMTAAFDETGDLRFSALGASLTSRFRNFSLQGEFIQTWQDLAEPEEPNPVPFMKAEASGGAKVLSNEPSESLTRSGYWVQLGYRLDKWDPILRWTQIFDGEIDGEHVTEEGRQLALGLDYWFEPSLALKFEYLINLEEDTIDNNRVAVQLAFGF
ncbi:MAG: hypothetical protein BMS9Abin05_0565 [Rhodothermia bacterium]|nr:MAG: hypothetical protein BMS9Abin05_0565 [Rhodothermia bacterium]